MPTAEQLHARLEHVRESRASGSLTVVFPDKASVTYKADAELAAIEASLVRQLADLDGSSVRTVLVHASKGLE